MKRWQIRGAGKGATWLVALVAALLAGTAAAHGLDMDRLGLQLMGERLVLVATPPVAALREFDRDRDGRLSAAELQAQRPAIARRLDALLQPRDGAGRVPALTFADVLVPGGGKDAPPAAADHVKVLRKYRFASPPAGLWLETGLATAGAQPLLVLFRADGQPLQTATLAPGTDGVALATAAPSEVQALAPWLATGAWHLLAGADHLLFLALLLWGARRLGEAGLCLTAFTLGHSLTLGLVLLQVVLVPAWAEAAIAASIVVTGARALAAARRPAAADRSGGLAVPLALAAGFGLVHGLGFAGALAGSGLPPAQGWLPLAGFNLGLEAGQLLVAAALWPLLAWLRQTQHPWLATGLAGGATGLGLAWLLQRL